jgi:hypothetical protein
MFSGPHHPEGLGRAGWGPGGRRFKSCLPDRSTEGAGLCSKVHGHPWIGFGEPKAQCREVQVDAGSGTATWAATEAIGSSCTRSRAGGERRRRA